MYNRVLSEYKGVIMHFFRIFIGLVSLLLLVGCGGGGSESGNSPSRTQEISEEIYQNSNLPAMKESVPSSLINKNNEREYNKVNQKVGDESTGFKLFQESLGYFYFKQMEMNMNLSYMDSVWSQIETYCQEKQSCLIPQNKIIFTYSQELYNHDIHLIEIYEEKSGDVKSFSILKDSLKAKIGEKSKLGEGKLVKLVDSPYDYELKVDISNVTFDNDKLITITKWNKENTLYEVREELIDGYNFDRGICNNRNSGIIYLGFDYNNTLDSTDNLYTYGYDMNCSSETIGVEEDAQSSYIQKHKQQIQLLELSDKIKLTEHISDKIIDGNYNTPLEFQAEGEVRENGGYMIFSDSEGYYYKEKFDLEGNILENINCMQESSNDFDTCILNGVDSIKKIITNNVYEVGVFSDTPVNAIATHSAVFFNENNRLKAYINCSIFIADYSLDDKGITFSNIEEENNRSLVCLDNSYQANFRNFLEMGYQFSEEGYVVWNGLSAELDTIGKKSEFDESAFMRSLTKNRYVDSYTMNNIFKVTSWDNAFLNPTTNKNYFLGSTPSMYIQNEKIYIDLIDATFEADLNVVNNDVLQFMNVIKTTKTDVIYPTRSCTNEPGLNECLDGDTSLAYEDEEFTRVIEEFLNKDVLVSNSGVVDNGILWMHNNNLSFTVRY